MHLLVRHKVSDFAKWKPVYDAHLSARQRVLSFPLLEDATWVAADETQPGYADRIAPLPTSAQLVWLRRNPAWRLV